MRKNNRPQTPPATSFLNLETLEERTMLSTVSVFAAGAAGDEAFELKIDDVVVSTFEDVGGDATARDFLQFDYTTSETLSASQIRVEFINDVYDEESGFDRNLFVDKIVVDGVTYETEHPSVFSTGVETETGFSGPGFLENETLNVNGSFFYSTEGASQGTEEVGTRIQLVARGEEGGEQVTLENNGVVLDTFTLTTSTESYFFQTDEIIPLTDIGVRFVNDLFDPSQGIDRNAVILSVDVTDIASEISTETTPATNPRIFSTGTWTEADGIADGFARGNILHSNGVMRFGGPDTVVESGPIGDDIAADEPIADEVPAEAVVVDVPVENEDELVLLDEVQPVTVSEELEVPRIVLGPIVANDQ